MAVELDRGYDQAEEVEDVEEELDEELVLVLRVVEVVRPGQLVIVGLHWVMVRV